MTSKLEFNLHSIIMNCIKYFHDIPQNKDLYEKICYPYNYLLKIVKVSSTVKFCLSIANKREAKRFLNIYFGFVICLKKLIDFDKFVVFSMLTGSALK